MTRVLKKGFTFLRNITKSIKDYMLNITCKIVKEVIDGILFSTLFDTFKDKGVWIIDSGASSHMTRECSKLQALSKGKSSHSI